MKTFSELNINLPESPIFEVPQTTIDEILNEKIEVLDFQLGIKTKYGPDRSIILIKKGEKQLKFWTDSTRIKSQLVQVNKKDLPFSAKVVVLRFGEKMKSYKFT